MLCIKNESTYIPQEQKKSLAPQHCSLLYHLRDIRYEGINCVTVKIWKT